MEGEYGGKERDREQMISTYSEHCIEADSNIASIVHPGTVRTIVIG